MPYQLTIKPKAIKTLEKSTTLTTPILNLLFTTLPVILVRMDTKSLRGVVVTV